MRFKKVLIVLVFSFLLFSCGKVKTEIEKKIESPFFGDKNSEVQMKIYTDFQCPACISFESRVGKYILKEFALKNKIGLTYKMFPLNFHKNAERDALGALCSSEQGKYKEFASEIYSLEEKIKGLKNTDEARIKIANKIGLDELKFTKCMSENHYLNKVKSDIKEGIDEKINSSGLINKKYIYNFN